MTLVDCPLCILCWFLFALLVFDVDVCMPITFCSAYDLKKNEKIIAFFNNFDYYLSEESLWQLSEMIKPRGSKTPVKQNDWKHWISDFCLLIDFPCVNWGIRWQLGARGLRCWSLLPWLEIISQSLNLWHCQRFELILFNHPDRSFSRMPALPSEMITNQGSNTSLSHDQWNGGGH